MQSAFSWERAVFLGGFALGILLFVFLVLMTAFRKIEQKDWAPLFAPGGVYMSLCMGGTLYYGKTLKLVGQAARLKDD